MNSSPDALLVLSHVFIQNVNTISSPLTWGFPSMTAILGFTHALERKLKNKSYDLKFGGTAIVCHKFLPQVYRTADYTDYTFCLTRNPLGRDEKSASMQEEGRAHIEISLMIEVYGEAVYINDAQQKEMAQNIFQIAQTLRLAGGSIFLQKNSHAQLIEWHTQFDEQQKKSKKLLRQLLPGFTLMNREDLLTTRTIELQALNPQATSLDALLEFSSLNFTPSTTKNGSEIEETNWTMRRKLGWIVPIPVGYRAISTLYKPGEVVNARDNSYPFQFVENIYSLGEWRSPHRIENINDIFWHYQFDEKEGLYRCINNINAKTIN